jgi:hypothetical protein
MFTTGSYMFPRVSIWGDWILPTLDKVRKWLTTGRTNSRGPSGPRHYRPAYR